MLFLSCPHVHIWCCLHPLLSFTQNAHMRHMSYGLVTWSIELQGRPPPICNQSPQHKPRFFGAHSRRIPPAVESDGPKWATTTQTCKVGAHLGAGGAGTPLPYQAPPAPLGAGNTNTIQQSKRQQFWSGNWQKAKDKGSRPATRGTPTTSASGGRPVHWLGNLLNPSAPVPYQLPRAHGPGDVQARPLV